jgi:hypothetical protein
MVAENPPRCQAAVAEATRAVEVATSNSHEIADASHAWHPASSARPDDRGLGDLGRMGLHSTRLADCTDLDTAAPCSEPGEGFNICAALA